MDSNMKFTNIQPLDTSSWRLDVQMYISGSQTYKKIYFDLYTHTPSEYYTLSGGLYSAVVPGVAFTQASLYRDRVPYNQNITVQIIITDVQGNRTIWSQRA